VDPLARLISARLPAALGQQFVVDILDKFHGELVKLFNQPDVRNQLGDQLGMDIVASSPAALQKFLVGEIERWGKVVRENNIRAE
jgi:tripartite-type tricarboxylate transporter receptor subunit TctC